jgi:hypothetical protein
LTVGKDKGESKAMESGKRLWIRIRLASWREIQTIQNMTGVELFRSSVRKIDPHNILIEGYVEKQVHETLKKKYAIRILGDVEKLSQEARRYVSKINRYRQK